MNQEFSILIRRRIRDEILWKVFWILLTLSLFIFLWFVTRRETDISSMFLFFAIAIILIIMFITIPRWRNYYISQSTYAAQFAETLEQKTKHLESTVDYLNQNPLPKDVFWINFIIDPATLSIEFETFSINEHPSLDTPDHIRNEIEALISIRESTITSLKKKGWDAEANLELSLVLIKIWISNTWNRIIQNSKLRATISIKNRSGYFNMTSNKWE